MNERYVVSLGMAKRLKEVGYEQDTEFIWIKVNQDRWELLLKENYYRYWHGNWVIISAPLISELLEQLTNDEIINFWRENKNKSPEDFINLFRSPDKMVEVWLEVYGR